MLARFRPVRVAPPPAAAMVDDAAVVDARRARRCTSPLEPVVPDEGELVMAGVEADVVREGAVAGLLVPVEPAVFAG